MSLMLGGLAATIVAEVPVLLERTLKQDAENNAYEHKCGQLKETIEVVKQRIEVERVKQHRLRIQLLKLRGPPPSRSGSVRELRGALEPCNTNSSPSISQATADSVTDFLSFVSDGSPVSLRSKRKGMVFDDDFRVSKRARKSTDSVSCSKT